MVSPPAGNPLVCAVILAQAPEVPKEVRVKALAGMAALALLAMLLMVMVWLAGRAVRRYVGRRPRPVAPPRARPHWHDDDWADTPLVSPDAPWTPPHDSD